MVHPLERIKLRILPKSPPQTKLEDAGNKKPRKEARPRREGLQAETTCVESMRIYTFRLPETGKSLYLGEMVEWFKAPVLKTGEAQASGGSNPSLSANHGPTQVGPFFVPKRRHTRMKSAQFGCIV
jgi:hypothetical protein